MSQTSLPNNWKRAQLKDACAGEPQNGAFIKNPEFGSGLPFVNVKDIYRGIVVDLKAVERLQCDEVSARRYALKEDDILFVRSSLKRDGIGQCCVVRGIRETAIYDCHLIRISPDKAKADALFLGYYFLSSRGKEDLIARSKTTTMTTINQQTLIETELVLPPTAEQRAIAHALRAVQEAGEARRKELQLERERKAALMQHLFTHGTRGESRKPTEIGEMPESWRVSKLGEVAKIERGKFAHRPRNDPAFYGGDIPFIQTGDVTAANGYIRTYSQTLNEVGLSVSRMFPKGTIVITIAANIGYTGILEFDSAFPDSLIAISPFENVDSKYLNYYLSTQQPEMDRKAPQGTQKNINIEFLLPWPVIQPSKSEQVAIANILSACDSKLVALQKESALLDELFRAMLEELMTGRLSTLPLIED